MLKQTDEKGTTTTELLIVLFLIGLLSIAVFWGWQYSNRKHEIATVEDLISKTVAGVVTGHYLEQQQADYRALSEKEQVELEWLHLLNRDGYISDVPAYTGSQYKEAFQASVGDTVLSASMLKDGRGMIVNLNQFSTKICSDILLSNISYDYVLLLEPMQQMPREPFMVWSESQIKDDANKSIVRRICMGGIDEEEETLDVGIVFTDALGYPSDNNTSGCPDCSVEIGGLCVFDAAQVPACDNPQHMYPDPYACACQCTDPDRMDGAAGLTGAQKCACLPNYLDTGDQCVCPTQYGFVEIIKDGFQNQCLCPKERPYLVDGTDNTTGAPIKKCVECLKKEDCDSYEMCSPEGICTCDTQNGFYMDGDGKCVCDTSLGFEIVNGVCMCVLPKKNEAGVCQCPQEAGYITDATGACICDTANGYYLTANGCVKCPDDAIYDPDTQACICDTKKGYYGRLGACEKIACIPNSEPFTANGNMVFCTEHDKWVRVDTLEGRIRVGFLDGWNGHHNYDYGLRGCRCTQYNTYNDMPNGGHYTDDTIHQVGYANYTLKFPVYIDMNAVGCSAGSRVYAVNSPNRWVYTGACTESGATEVNISYSLQSEIVGYKCPVEGASCDSNNMCVFGDPEKALGQNICGLIDADENCVCPFGKEKQDGRCDWFCDRGQVIQSNGECACPEGLQMINNWCRLPGCDESKGFTEKDGQCVCNEAARYYTKADGSCQLCAGADQAWNYDTKTCDSMCPEAVYTVSSPSYSAEYRAGRYNAETQTCECNTQIYFFGEYPNCHRCQTIGAIWDEKTQSCVCDLEKGWMDTDGTCHSCAYSARPNEEGTGCVCQDTNHLMDKNGSCYSCSELTESTILAENLSCSSCPGWFTAQANNACFKCTNTKKVVSTLQECQMCDNRYWESKTGQCRLCPTGMKASESGEACECDEGYMFSYADNKCYPCSETRARTTTLAECQACGNRYWKNNSCMPCGEGGIGSEDGLFCSCSIGETFFNQAKPTVCAACDTTAAILTYADASASCGTGVRYMASNSYSYLCTQTTSYPATEAEACFSCGTNVRTLSSKNQCYACQYTGRFATSLENSQRCQNRYWRSDNGYSYMCPSGTKATADGLGCVCPAGEYFSYADGKCYPCENTTSKKATFGACHVCEGRYWREKDNMCLVCTGNTTSEDGLVCSGCAQNAFFSAQDNKCYSCADTVNRYATLEACQTCQNRYWQTDRCILCPNGSLVAEDGLSCSCSAGETFFNASNKTCVDCDITTAVVSSEQASASCGIGKRYFAEDGKSYLCTASNTPKTTEAACHGCGDDIRFLADDDTCSLCSRSVAIKASYEESRRCSNRYWRSDKGYSYICPSGTKATADGLGCVCPEGQYFSYAANTCLSCTSKTASHATTQAECMSCGQGERLWRSSDGACISCDYTSAIAVAQDESRQCPNRYWKASDARSYLCPNGTNATSDGLGCTCAAGEILNTSNQCQSCSVKGTIRATEDECSSCDNRFFYGTNMCALCTLSSAASNTTWEECQKCPQRYWYNKRCRPCPSGQGSGNGKTCVCPTGQFFSTSANKCVACTEKRDTQTSYESCQACEGRYYNWLTGSCNRSTGWF